VEEIGQRTAAVAEPVLDSVEDHIEDNDIDVIISGNEIHVEGDEAGVKKVNADIREVLSEGVHVEYDREEGITLAIDDEPE
jgi:formaldehyde-activating enzyme involved in methanogenesis